jgi:radical SAM protein with 4Fe4S-binding SPASM domain
MDEQKARALLASKLTWIGVSIDGNTAQTYEAMRVGASFEQVSANVERLLQINRQEPRSLPTIAIQVIASRTAMSEFEAVAAHWREQAGTVENVRIELKPYTTWAGQVEADELFTPDPRASFFFTNCGHPYDTMVIDADGRLALCCYDVQATEGLGNANDTPLRELWQGLRLNQIRRQLAVGRCSELPLCRNCSMGRKYPADFLP